MQRELFVRKTYAILTGDVMPQAEYLRFKAIIEGNSFLGPGQLTDIMQKTVEGRRKLIDRLSRRFLRRGATAAELARYVDAFAHGGTAERVEAAIIGVAIS